MRVPSKSLPEICFANFHAKKIVHFVCSVNHILFLLCIIFHNLNIRKNVR
jgi:hypothetical protein